MKVNYGLVILALVLGVVLVLPGCEMLSGPEEDDTPAGRMVYLSWSIPNNDANLAQYCLKTVDIDTGSVIETVCDDDPPFYDVTDGWGTTIFLHQSATRENLRFEFEGSTVGGQSGCAVVEFFHSGAQNPDAQQETLSISDLGTCDGGNDTGTEDEDVAETNETIERITDKTNEFLPSDEQDRISEILSTATASELEEIDTAVDDFVDAADAHFELHDELWGSGVTAQSLSDFVRLRNEVQAAKDILVDGLGGNWQAVLFERGIGYERAILGGEIGTLSAGLGVGVVGNLEAGSGYGIAFDFRNFQRYRYYTEYVSGSVGVTVGLTPTSPIEFSAGDTAVYVASLVHGYGNEARYRNTVAIGAQQEAGLTAAFRAAIGVSISRGSSRIIGHLSKPHPTQHRA